MILAADITPTIARLWQTGFREAARGLLEANIGIPFHDASIFAQERAGWLVRELDEVTRERIREVLGRELGPAFDNPDVTPAHLAEVLQAEFDAMSQARAEMIARTETAYAAAYGNAAVWQRAGVEEVEISDGDYDEACAAADGQVWSLAEYLANPLEHPNCTRAGIPVIATDEEIAA